MQATSERTLAMDVTDAYAQVLEDNNKPRRE